MSINTKIRHYTTVIKPKPKMLYASETLNLNYKGNLENIKKADRKIIRKILLTSTENKNVNSLDQTSPD